MEKLHYLSTSLVHVDVHIRHGEVEIVTPTGERKSDLVVGNPPYLQGLKTSLAALHRAPLVRDIAGRACLEIGPDGMIVADGAAVRLSVKDTTAEVHLQHCVIHLIQAVYHDSANSTKLREMAQKILHAHAKNRSYFLRDPVTCVLIVRLARELYGIKKPFNMSDVLGDLMTSKYELEIVGLYMLAHAIGPLANYRAQLDETASQNDLDKVADTILRYYTSTGTVRRVDAPRVGSTVKIDGLDEVLGSSCGEFGIKQDIDMLGDEVQRAMGALLLCHRGPGDAIDMATGVRTAFSESLEDRYIPNVNNSTPLRAIIDLRDVLKIKLVKAGSVLKPGSFWRLPLPTSLFTTSSANLRGARITNIFSPRIAFQEQEELLDSVSVLLSENMWSRYSMQIAMGAIEKILAAHHNVASADQPRSSAQRLVQNSTMLKEHIEQLYTRDEKYVSSWAGRMALVNSLFVRAVDALRTVRDIPDEEPHQVTTFLRRLGYDLANRGTRQTIASLAGTTGRWAVGAAITAATGIGTATAISDALEACLRRSLYGYKAVSALASSTGIAAEFMYRRPDVKENSDLRATAMIASKLAMDIASELEPRPDAMIRRCQTLYDIAQITLSDPKKLSDTLQELTELVLALMVPSDLRARVAEDGYDRVQLMIDSSYADMVHRATRHAEEALPRILKTISESLSNKGAAWVRPIDDAIRIIRKFIRAFDTRDMSIIEVGNEWVRLASEEEEGMKKSIDLNLIVKKNIREMLKTIDKEVHRPADFTVEKATGLDLNLLSGGFTRKDTVHFTIMAIVSGTFDTFVEVAPGNGILKMTLVPLLHYGVHTFFAPMLLERVYSLGLVQRFMGTRNADSKTNTISGIDAALAAASLVSADIISDKRWVAAEQNVDKITLITSNGTRVDMTAPAAIDACRGARELGEFFPVIARELSYDCPLCRESSEPVSVLQFQQFGLQDIVEKIKNTDRAMRLFYIYAARHRGWTDQISVTTSVEGALSRDSWDIIGENTMRVYANSDEAQWINEDPNSHEVINDKKIQTVAIKEIVGQKDLEVIDIFPRIVQRGKNNRRAVNEWYAVIIREARGKDVTIHSVSLGELKQRKQSYDDKKYERFMKQISDGIRGISRQAASALAKVGGGENFGFFWRLLYFFVIMSRGNLFNEFLVADIANDGQDGGGESRGQSRDRDMGALPEHYDAINRELITHVGDNVISQNLTIGSLGQGTQPIIMSQLYGDPSTVDSDPLGVINSMFWSNHNLGLVTSPSGSLTRQITYTLYPQPATGRSAEPTSLLEDKTVTGPEKPQGQNEGDPSTSGLSVSSGDTVPAEQQQESGDTTADNPVVVAQQSIEKEEAEAGSEEVKEETSSSSGDALSQTKKQQDESVPASGESEDAQSSSDSLPEQQQLQKEDPSSSKSSTTSAKGEDAQSSSDSLPEQQQLQKEDPSSSKSSTTSAKGEDAQSSSDSLPEQQQLQKEDPSSSKSSTTSAKGEDAQTSSDSLPEQQQSQKEDPSLSKSSTTSAKSEDAQSSSDSPPEQQQSQKEDPSLSKSSTTSEKSEDAKSSSDSPPEQQQSQKEDPSSSQSSGASGPSEDQSSSQSSQSSGQNVGPESTEDIGGSGASYFSWGDLYTFAQADWPTMSREQWLGSLATLGATLVFTHRVMAGRVRVIPTTTPAHRPDDTIPIEFLNSVHQTAGRSTVDHTAIMAFLTGLATVVSTNVADSAGALALYSGMGAAAVAAAIPFRSLLDISLMRRSESPTPALSTRTGSQGDAPPSVVEQNRPASPATASWNLSLRGIPRLFTPTSSSSSTVSTPAGLPAASTETDSPGDKLSSPDASLDNRLLELDQVSKFLVQEQGIQFSAIERMADVTTAALRGVAYERPLVLFAQYFPSGLAPGDFSFINDLRHKDSMPQLIDEMRCMLQCGRMPVLVLDAASSLDVLGAVTETFVRYKGLRGARVARFIVPEDGLRDECARLWGVNKGSSAIVVVYGESMITDSRVNLVDKSGLAGQHLCFEETGTRNCSRSYLSDIIYQWVYVMADDYNIGSGMPLPTVNDALVATMATKVSAVENEIKEEKDLQIQARVELGIQTDEFMLRSMSLSPDEIVAIKDPWEDIKQLYDGTKQTMGAPGSYKRNAFLFSAIAVRLGAYVMAATAVFQIYGVVVAQLTTGVPAGVWGKFMALFGSTPSDLATFAMQIPTMFTRLISNNQLMSLLFGGATLMSTFESLQPYPTLYKMAMRAIKGLPLGTLRWIMNSRSCHYFGINMMMFSNLAIGFYTGTQDFGAHVNNQLELQGDAEELEEYSLRYLLRVVRELCNHEKLQAPQDVENPRAFLNNIATALNKGNTRRSMITHPDKINPYIRQQEAGGTEDVNVKGLEERALNIQTDLENFKDDFVKGFQDAYDTYNATVETMMADKDPDLSAFVVRPVRVMFNPRNDDLPATGVEIDPSGLKSLCDPSYFEQGYATLTADDSVLFGSYTDPVMTGPTAAARAVEATLNDRELTDPSERLAAVEDTLLTLAERRHDVNTWESYNPWNLVENKRGDPNALHSSEYNVTGVRRNVVSELENRFIVRGRGSEGPVLAFANEPPAGVYNTLTDELGTMVKKAISEKSIDVDRFINVDESKYLQFVDAELARTEHNVIEAAVEELVRCLRDVTRGFIMAMRIIDGDGPNTEKSVAQTLNVDQSMVHGTGRDLLNKFISCTRVIGDEAVADHSEKFKDIALMKDSQPIASDGVDDTQIADWYDSVGSVPLMVLVCMAARSREDVYDAAEAAGIAAAIASYIRDGAAYELGAFGAVTAAAGLYHTIVYVIECLGRRTPVTDSIIPTHMSEDARHVCKFVKVVAARFGTQGIVSPLLTSRHDIWRDIWWPLLRPA